MAPKSSVDPDKNKASVTLTVLDQWLYDLTKRITK
jgi:hypothetical protein